MNPKDRTTQLPESLAGRTIFLTGSTGFVGTAVLERLLRLDVAKVVLLIRDGRRRSAVDRMKREILRNNAFDPLRAEVGDETFQDLTSRIHVVSGDVGADGLGLDPGELEALAECDTVIHSAATVAFDAPLDRAVEINLLGPVRLAETIRAAGSRPHLVVVSTCYVAGNKRGDAAEEPVTANPFFGDIDWRAEVTASRRTRGDVDARSRTPERLDGFHADARSEIGPAGGPLLADKTEEMRRDWVADEMVEAGRARARSLGWPDAYALSKALGEVALTETLAGFGEGGPATLSIVRPSIIESALELPRPGWIRGFRMAEPIILSYARGLLKEFPGVPEGIIDVIPVDLVVSAIVAAAQNPQPDSTHDPDIIQVASGSRNPLHYQVLVDEVRDWFTATPIHDDHGQPIIVPDWSFPGRGRVERQLTTATTALKKIERVVSSLPLRGKAAEWGADLESKRSEAQRALDFVKLYGAYTECEAIYGVDRLLELGVDPAVIDWPTYIAETHIPSVVKHGRASLKPTRKDPDQRSRRLRSQVLSEKRHLAAFDLENTLIASNVVASYAWLASRRLDKIDRVRLVGRLLAEAPSLMAADRRDRSDFLREFYRRYEGAPLDEVTQDSAEAFSRLLLDRAFPEAIRRVRQHRRLGHRTVLITGALDIVVEPIRPLFDDVICAVSTKEQRNGRTVLTGHLRSAPPTAEARATAIEEICAVHGLDPAESVAYADSSSDLSMLNAVGYPVAVNPEPRLATIARKRGWLIEEFTTAKGHKPTLLPLAPRWTGANQ